MKPGVHSAVRIPDSIALPQRRGSIGNERIGESTASAVVRRVIGGITKCVAVNMRFEDF